MGESVACWFLSTHGLTPVARNVEVPGGEIDILTRDGRERVAVEVRARSGPGDPIDAIDPSKRARVIRLAARAGADRVDLVGVRLGDAAAEIHWVPGV